jgi:hypothetical protein
MFLSLSNRRTIEANVMSLEKDIFLRHVESAKKGHWWLIPSRPPSVNHQSINVRSSGGGLQEKTLQTGGHTVWHSNHSESSIFLIEKKLSSIYLPIYLSVYLIYLPISLSHLYIYLSIMIVQVQPLLIKIG